MRLSHDRRDKRTLKAKIIKKDLQNPDLIVVPKKPVHLEFYQAVSSVSKPQQAGIGYQNQIPKQVVDIDEEGQDSKYGVAVFEASQTELGQDSYDSSLDHLATEDIMVIMALRERTGTSYKTTIEDVLEEIGMHIIEPDEDDYNLINDFDLVD